MNSKPLQGVTLTVLRDVDDYRKSEGWITLRSEAGIRMRSVQVAKLSDLPPLKGADLALRDAERMLFDAIADASAPRLKEAILNSARWDRSPGELVFDFDQNTEEEMKAAGRHWRSFLMNLALSRCELVVWSSHNGQRPAVPAIYCPDDASAVFALTLTQNTRLCANPKCRAPFVQTSKRQIYHLESCGIATRTRRSRARAARLAKKNSAR